MNLLFYAPQMAAYGGIERHVCGLARAAAEQGHDVVFLTTSNSLGHDLREEIDHPHIGFHELPLARGSARFSAKLVWLSLEILRCRFKDWKAVYTNGQSAFSRIVWAAARPGTRVIHHHHNAGDPVEQATWSKAYRRVLTSAPELVGCSDATCAALNRATGRTDARFMPYLTRCSVPDSAIIDRPPHEPLRLGFSGRLIPEKGIDMILDLARDNELHDIEWHIHGAGPAYPPARFAGVPRLIYHGAYYTASEQATALNALDGLVLFSTHNEGMPLSLIEAMSAGLPWIASDRGGTHELAASPEDCLIVPADAPKSAVRMSVRAMAARIRAGTTSRRRQRTVYDRLFAPPVVAAQWLDFLLA